MDLIERPNILRDKEKVVCSLTVPRSVYKLEGGLTCRSFMKTERRATDGEMKYFGVLNFDPLKGEIADLAGSGDFRIGSANVCARFVTVFKFLKSPLAIILASDCLHIRGF